MSKPQPMETIDIYFNHKMGALTYISLNIKRLRSHLAYVHVAKMYEVEKIDNQFNKTFT